MNDAPPMKVVSPNADSPIIRVGDVHVYFYEDGRVRMRDKDFMEIERIDADIVVMALRFMDSQGVPFMLARR